MKETLHALMLEIMSSISSLNMPDEETGRDGYLSEKYVWAKHAVEHLQSALDLQRVLVKMVLEEDAKNMERASYYILEATGRRVAKVSGDSTIYCPGCGKKLDFSINKEGDYIVTEYRSVRHSCGKNIIEF